MSAMCESLLRWDDFKRLQVLEFAAGARADALKSESVSALADCECRREVFCQIGNVQGGLLLGFFQSAQTGAHDFAGIA